MLRYESFARPTATEVLAHEFFADFESLDVQRNAERSRLLVFERLSPSPSSASSSSSAIGQPPQHPPIDGSISVDDASESVNNILVKSDYSYYKVLV